MSNSEKRLAKDKVLIALCGKKQTGKSTSFKFIQEILKNKIVRRYSFAQKLKDIVTDLFGVEYNMLIGSDKEKDSPTYLLWSDVAENIKKKFFNGKLESGKYITHRELLQLVGTDLFRAVRSAIWPEYLQRTLLLSDADVLVVDDARFPNEVEILRDMGGKLVKIYRYVDSPNATDHPSETALDNIDDSYYDFVITDNGNRTMEDLRNSWIKILKEIV